MYVYLVCCDFGSYMEPDIEILKIFKHKKDSLSFINKMRNKYFRSSRHIPFILKRKVYLNYD